jgi:eukaryotic-like serine/threonine-protein kinase
MKDDLAHLDTLRTQWNDRGITIENRPFPTTQTIGNPPSALPTIRCHDSGIDTPELILGETIGEGGMGVVVQATQFPLAREVAVKHLRNDQPDQINEDELVREARVTGALDHPNIIPIHNLILTVRN